MSTTTATAQTLDTREAQASRVADSLEQFPASTQKEIDARCDTGCISKVLSEMPRLGYRLQKGWREAACRSGVRRRVRTYTLTQRPGVQPDLFSSS